METEKTTEEGTGRTGERHGEKKTEGTRKGGKGKSGIRLSASFMTGTIALVFLVVGYQVALFLNRAAVSKVLADRSSPDTVYIAVAPDMNDITEYEGTARSGKAGTGNIRITSNAKGYRIDQQTGEHVVLAFVGAALADFSPLLLHLLKYGPFNDWLVDILEDDPILTVILQSLFVLVGFGVGLEVENVTAILLQRQDFGHGGTVPLGSGLLLSLSGALDALFQPIGTWGKDFVLFKLGCNLFRSVALQGHAVNPPNHLGGFVIYDPLFRIVGVFDVTVGRLAHRLARISLDLVADTPLLADVTGVPLIEQVADRRQLVLALGGVDVIRYRHQANVVLREKFFGQSANLDVVTAQSGKVFDKYRSGCSYGPGGKGL